MSQTAALSISDARQQLFQSLTPITDSEVLAIEHALGRILDHDVLATENVPAFDNSAMDGYAVRFEDLSLTGETRLTIAGTALAGNAFGAGVRPGQSVRIMTGAVLPAGADTVVMQEDVRLERNEVIISSAHAIGENVRYAGESLKKGEPALLGGKLIAAADLGLLAAIGVPRISVKRRLRVAVMSTGDELTPVDQPLTPGQIHDSNRYSLIGLLKGLGVEIIDLGIVRDTPEALETALSKAAASADVIITSGGVSVGEADFVKDLVARLGEIRFWKLRIKPGKPMAFGRIGKAWFFGLPGNPVAVMVAFQTIVQDALLKLMGCSPLPERPTFKTPCASSIKSSPGRQEYLRGILFNESGNWLVQLTGEQGSGILTSMSRANCFVVIPEATTSIEAGALVDVLPFATIGI